MDKENENNASVEGITTAVFCREGDLKQFTDVFARLGRSCTAAQKGGIDEAQAWLTQHDAPGLLIVDISASPFPVPALADLAALAGPGCRIAAVGAEEMLNYTVRSSLPAHLTIWFRRWQMLWWWSSSTVPTAIAGSACRMLQACGSDRPLR